MNETRGTQIIPKDVSKQAPAIWVESRVPQTRHEYLLHQIKPQFEQLERMWWPKKEQYLRWWMLYRSYLTPRLDPDDWRTNLFIPLAFSMVETWEPRLVAAYFQNDELVEATATNPIDEPFAKSVEAELNWQFNYRMKHLIPTIGIAKWAAIMGQGVGKVWFDRRVRTQNVPDRVVVENPFSGQAFSIGTNRRERDVVTFEGLRLECVDPFGLYWNPSGNMEDSDFIYEQNYRTDGWIRKQIAAGRFLNVDLGHPQMFADKDPFRQRRMELIAGDLSGAMQGAGTGWAGGMEDMLTQMNKAHEIIEAHADLEDGKPGKWRRFIVSVANREHVLEARRYPLESDRWMYVPLPFTPQPNDPFPVGMIEPIESIQMMLNDYHAMGLDSIKLILNRMFIVDPTGFEDDEQFQTRPGAIWHKLPGRDTGSIFQAVDTPDVPPSFWSEMSFLNDLVQRVTGVSDYFAGVNTENQRRLTPTKGGMEMMLQQASNRFNLNAQIAERVFFDGVAQVGLELLQLYKQEPTNLRITEDQGQMDWRTITKDDILGEYRFGFRSNLENVNKSAERDDLVFLFRELVNSFQLDGGGSIDPDQLRKVLIEKFDVPGLERIFRQTAGPQGNPMLGGDPMTAMTNGAGLPPNGGQLQALAQMLGGGGAGAPPARKM